MLGLNTFAAFQKLLYVYIFGISCTSDVVETPYISTNTPRKQLDQFEIMGQDKTDDLEIFQSNKMPRFGGRAVAAFPKSLNVNVFGITCTSDVVETPNTSANTPGKQLKLPEMMGQDKEDIFSQTKCPALAGGQKSHFKFELNSSQEYLRYKLETLGIGKLVIWLYCAKISNQSKYNCGRYSTFGDAGFFFRFLDFS